MFFSSKNTESGAERYKQEIEGLKKELAFYKEIAGFRGEFRELVFI